MTRRPALLLDIDGVLVHEIETREALPTEVLLLHADVVAHLSCLEGAVFFVTHRSQREARQILACVGLNQRCINHCFAAEDILRSALKRWRLRSLLVRGLHKSLILPELKLKHGIDPAQLCFVDDRVENIQDMLQAGVGLCLLAPIRRETADAFITFDFQEVIEKYHDWAESLDDAGFIRSQLYELRTRQQPIETWCRTGVSTRRSARSVFNYGRRLGRLTRRLTR